MCPYILVNILINLLGEFVLTASIDSATLSKTKRNVGN